MTAPGTNSTVCYQCNAPVDSLRAAVKIIDSRIHRVCASCRSGDASVAPTDEGQRAVGDASVLATASTESVDATAKAEEFAGEALAGAPHQEESVVAPSWTRRFLSKRRAVGLAVVVIVSIPVLAMALVTEPSLQRAEFPDLGNQRPATILLSLDTSSLEIFEPAELALVDASGWVHPVVGSEEKVPTKGTRLFGAERPGDRPAECRRGHCGVDLDAPRGAPVVAVRPGVIEKVVYDENASGGRYVWIRHDDLNLRTEYFHFDRVAPGLVAGESVVAGQWLGTLGRSGIEHSAPHLHFALRDLSRGDRYIDPLRFLQPARVVDLLELRLAKQD